MKNNIKVQTDNRGNFLLVTLTGELSIRTLSYFKKIVLTEIQENNYTNAVIDCSACTYIDSAGIALISSLSQKFAKLGGKLGLIEPSESVNDVLAVSDMGTSLVEFKDIEDAGAHFS